MYGAFVPYYDPSLPNYNGLLAAYGLSKLLSFESIIYQELLITSGWNGVSLVYEPMDTNVENMLTPIVDVLVIISNLSSVYWPQIGVNTMVNWNNEFAYANKLTESLRLELCGMALNGSLIINKGWNYLPVLMCSVNVEDWFYLVVNDLVIVQEIAGTGF